MKKISKKLSLSRETVRLLSSDQLDAVEGGGTVASPTTTIYRHTIAAAAAAAHGSPCHHASGTVITAMCVRPPAAG